MLLSFINKNGKSITLPKGENLILQDWSGFANNNTELVTNKAPDQIGFTVVKKIYNSRAMNIQFTIKENNRQAVFDKRKEIISIFSSGGTLIWRQNDGTTYQIDVEIENLEMPSGSARNNTFQEVQVDFIAENPLWKKEDPVRSQLSIGSTVDILNNGDIRTPFILKIDGPIDNPVIKNMDNNAEMKLNESFSEDQTIIFITEFGNKRVYLESENNERYNIMRSMDLDSKMFYLGVGNNSILVDGSNTVNRVTSAEIEFYERFLGV